MELSTRQRSLDTMIHHIDKSAPTPLRYFPFNHTRPPNITHRMCKFEISMHVCGHMDRIAEPCSQKDKESCQSWKAGALLPPQIVDVQSPCPSCIENTITTDNEIAENKPFSFDPVTAEANFTFTPSVGKSTEKKGKKSIIIPRSTIPQVGTFALPSTNGTFTFTPPTALNTASPEEPAPANIFTFTTPTAPSTATPSETPSIGTFIFNHANTFWSSHKNGETGWQAMINNRWWDELQSVTNKMKKVKKESVAEPDKFKFEVAGKLGDLLDVHRKGRHVPSRSDLRFSVYRGISYYSSD